MNNELILLEHARALDQEALGLVHDTYYQPIRRYISFRISDEATVEDLTSEVFVRFLTALRDRHGYGDWHDGRSSVTSIHFVRTG